MKTPPLNDTTIAEKEISALAGIDEIRHLVRYHAEVIESLLRVTSETAKRNAVLEAKLIKLATYLGHLDVME